jgi:hypothetical protein
MHAVLSLIIIASNSFEPAQPTIPSDDNCTTLSTITDADYERNEVFDVKLLPQMKREPDADVNPVVSFTVILEDSHSEY